MLPIRIEILSHSSFKRQTWKNGLGHTDEIAIHPAGADLRRGDFLWRLSSARIEQSSPFSVFPQHDRTLVVLRGAGVRLTHSFVVGSSAHHASEESEFEEAVDVGSMEPYEFPGDVPSRCELMDGPIEDLSVFIRKAEVEASVEIIDLPGDPEAEFAWSPHGRWNFAFAAQGRFKIDGPLLGAPALLGERDAVRAELDSPLDEGAAIRFRADHGNGQLVIVTLNPA
jgi:environmental stress-induced protein Ves